MLRWRIRSQNLSHRGASYAKKSLLSTYFEIALLATLRLLTTLESNMNAATQTHTPSAPQDMSFADLYNQHFVPKNDAVGGLSVVQASSQFKIFSLNDNNVNIVYSNQTGK
jgi:hypothetical protein